MAGVEVSVIGQSDNIRGEPINLQSGYESELEGLSDDELRERIQTSHVAEEIMTAFSLLPGIEQKEEMLYEALVRVYRETTRDVVRHVATLMKADRIGKIAIEAAQQVMREELQ